MKFIPESKHDCLILSGIHEMCHEHGVSEEVANQVSSDFSSYFQKLENDPEAEYENENQKIARLFQLWINALHEGNKTLAKQYEAEIDQSVGEHPFPYAETKGWYKYSTSKGYPKEATYSDALENYRDYKKSPWDKVSDFGLIKNKVSKDAKIGIIGDWGTGTDDAIYLLKKMLERAPDIEVILHLGDIYQCATPFECAQNFLDPINKVFSDLNIPRVPVFTIPGNHEYYTGAKGYFQLIDVLNSDLDEGWKQQASYFCLESEGEDGDKWQFLGADTGLNCINEETEPGLQVDEAAWHISRLNAFKGKSIMMTHHQFVSADSYLSSTTDPLKGGADLFFYNQNLLQQFSSCLDQIDLWIWGHDHWFIPYVQDLPIPEDDKKLKLKRGQLLGGSARETKGSSRSVIYTSAVQKDENNQPILPSVSADGLSNHTYGIIDLKQSNISYYEIGAWDKDSEAPNHYAPEDPLFVCDL